MAARSPDRTDRCGRAVELRARGWLWKQIARELGYKSPDAARVDVDRALQERIDRRQGVGQLREIEIEHLDALRQRVWQELDRKHPYVQGGRVVHAVDENGIEHMLEDSGPVLAAVDRLVKLSERKARLTGIDQPIAVDVRQVSYNIDGVDVEKLR